MDHARPLSVRYAIAFAVGLALTCGIAFLNTPSAYASGSAASSTSSQGVVYTFSESGVSASDSTADGASIEGTTLTIVKAGTYTVTGSCSEGGIVVKKDVGDVTLVLDNLTLANSSTAPVLVKKAEKTGSKLTLQIVGTVSLSDNEDASSEDAEGAAIKVNKMDTEKASSGNTLVIEGDGVLNIDASHCKNGIKGGVGATVQIDGATINIAAANNGIASDGTVVVNGGTINLGSESAPIGNDGIKSEPDGDDTVSKGLVKICGGIITSYTNGDGIQASYETVEGVDKSATNQGIVEISAGSFDITTMKASAAAGDGIQAETKLQITGGTFKNITTWGGSTQGSAFEKADAASTDGLSAKGLKVGRDKTGELLVSGGTFALIDTADDCIHSDGTLAITAGSFKAMKAGDDAIHADYQLDIGDASNTASTQPVINVASSAEGFESAKVNVYSGTNTIYYSDDGINAANKDFGDNSSAYDFLITIAGGTNKIISMKAGDCLDSNGSIVISGGTTFLNSWPSGDGDLLDAGDLQSDTVKITGGTLFGLGHSVGNTPSTGTYVLFGSSAMGGFSGQQGWFGGPGGQGPGAMMGQQGSLSIPANAQLTIKDASSTRFSMTSTNAASLAIYSDESLASDTTYTLYANGQQLASASANTGAGNSSGQTSGGWQPGQGMPGDFFGPPYFSETTNTTDATNTTNTGETYTTAGSLADATISKISNKKYTGSSIKPSLTVTLNGKKLVAGVDYVATYSNCKKVGTATVTIKPTSTSAYTGSKTVTYKIVKATNTLKVSKKTLSVKATQLTSKSKAIKAITVKNAKGKVTYTRVSGSKYLKVNSSGKIIVKAGTPKGTYKIKVRVRAAGNSGYNAMTKTVTVTVKVK